MYMEMRGSRVQIHDSNAMFSRVKRNNYQAHVVHLRRPAGAQKCGVNEIFLGFPGDFSAFCLQNAADCIGMQTQIVWRIRGKLCEFLVEACAPLTATKLQCNGVNMQ